MATLQLRGNRMNQPIQATEMIAYRATAKEPLAAVAERFSGWLSMSHALDLALRLWAFVWSAVPLGSVHDGHVL